MKLPSLQAVHVVVVGDVMLDRYWFGDAHRVSQEAPVPVVNVTSIEDRPGGAANVALNIASLGARCTLIGVVGDDEAARALEDTLTAAGVSCDFVVSENNATVIKLRVLSQKQQLLRTDFESPLRSDVGDLIGHKLGQHLGDATAVVLQDYDKGVLSAPQGLIEQARRAGVPVIVDPKHKPFSSYAGASLIKPNAQEFEIAVGPWKDDDDLLRKARMLAVEHDFDALVITRGGAGMTVVEMDGSHQHIPGRPVDVFDVTGAGDTAAAVLAVGRSLGWQPVACAQLANVASGIVVGKTGTAAVTGPELARALALENRNDRGIMSRAQLADSVQQAQTAAEKIVFTNGCFDILHAGHVAYLEEARALGDRLIVAVNDDASVLRLKGKGRPVNPLEQRQRVLAGLSAVDWIVSFSEDTPEALLQLLQPDILVKGGDYPIDEVVGAEIVQGYGGRVEVLSLVDDCSTTAIVERIQNEQS